VCHGGCQGGSGEAGTVLTHNSRCHAANRAPPRLAQPVLERIGVAAVPGASKPSALAGNGRRERCRLGVVGLRPCRPRGDRHIRSVAPVPRSRSGRCVLGCCGAPGLVEGPPGSPPLAPHIGSGPPARAEELPRTGLRHLQNRRRGVLSQRNAQTVSRLTSAASRGPRY